MTPSFQQYRNRHYPLIRDCTRHGSATKWHACPICTPGILGGVLKAEANVLWPCKFPGGGE
jgi:hypothetical protein